MRYLKPARDKEALQKVNATFPLPETNIRVGRRTCLGRRLVQRHLPAKPIGNRLRVKTDEATNPEMRNRALFHKAIDGHLARRKDLCEFRGSQRVRHFFKLDC